jgi:hypothetical protein
MIVENCVKSISIDKKYGMCMISIIMDFDQLKLTKWIKIVANFRTSYWGSRSQSSLADRRGLSCSPAPTRALLSWRGSERWIRLQCLLILLSRVNK